MSVFSGVSSLIPTPFDQLCGNFCTQYASNCRVALRRILYQSCPWRIDYESAWAFVSAKFAADKLAEGDIPRNAAEGT